MRPLPVLASATFAVGALILLAAPSAHANGLLTSEDPATGRATSSIHLVSHRVKASVRDRLAEVVVEQAFRSEAAVPLEATYLFPLPEGAAVHRFEMQVAGETLGGEVIEAARARGIYEEIVRRRKDPGLLEYVGRDLFRARVFPVPPGKDVTVRLAFQALLPEDAGTVSFRYPLSTDRLNGQAVADVRVDVDVESAVALRAIYSTSHEIELRRDGERRAHVGFASTARRQDRDFVLYFARSPEDVGFSVLSHRDAGEDGTFLAVVAPRAEGGPRVAKDVVFVLDTSGSMAGKKIEQATAALAYGIRTLGERDRFRVVAFSSGVRVWAEGWTVATPDRREAAAAWLAAQPAEGGTNIEAALRSALESATDRPCYVVFMTDGRPTVGTTAPDALLQQVRDRGRSAARVFTFGVGHDLDVGLLDRIAEATRGRRDYVLPDEDIEVATGRFFRKVGHPVLTDVTLDLGADVHDVHPAELGDLFAGEQVVVLGRYGKPGAHTLRLSGRAGELAVTREYATVLSGSSGVRALPRLWAQRKVAYLLDQVRLHGPDREVVQEIVTLATRHAIVTPYTAGLVVEDAARPVIREGAVADHVETDSDLPFQESFGAGEGVSDAPFEGPLRNGLIGLGGGSGGAFRSRGGARDLRGGGGGRRQSEDAVERALRWLAANQSADGSWRMAVEPGPRDVAVTGLALSAFLGAGFTNRGGHPFARVVSRGLRHLKSIQGADGRFADATAPQATRDHALAALAMVEAYGMTESPIFRGSAHRAVTALLDMRAPDGLWRERGDPGLDPVATAWALWTLRSARRIDADRVAAVRAPAFPRSEAVDGDVRRWLEGPGTPPPAIAAAAHLFLGDAPAQSNGLRAAIDALAADPLPGGPNTSLEGSYFGGLVAFQAGDAAWKRWDDALRTTVVGRARTDGDETTVRGSWDPTGAHDVGLGRTGSTALLAMCLEVRWLYDRELTDAGERMVVARPVPDAAAHVGDSERLRDLEESVGLDDGGRDDGLDAVRARVRRVEGKTFVLHADGRWIDRAWDGSTRPERVEAYSETWFRLAASGDVVRACLSVGDRVVFVHDGKVYEVAPGAPPPASR